jgi:pyridoxine 5-phosphate synthase
MACEFPPLLGVNVDHVATLRQQRGTHYPDPVQLAQLAEQAGADGITVHLREDRRHIQDRDVERLGEVVETRLNLEMAVTDEMLAFAERQRPAYCCLVPERREELTTEGGLDVAGQPERIADACARLAAAGVQVSLFVDAEPAQLEAARACAAPLVELHTGHFADASGTRRDQELQRIAEGVRIGRELGLKVNAGHGLNYHNVQAVAALDGIVEFNIGHAIIARALVVGMSTAVRDMKALLVQARG